MTEIKIPRADLDVSDVPVGYSKTFTLPTGWDSGTVLGLSVFGPAHHPVALDATPTPVTFGAKPITFSPENPLEVTYVNAGDNDNNAAFGRACVRVVYVVDEDA
jgi:hypothetical protein